MPKTFKMPKMPKMASKRRDSYGINKDVMNKERRLFPSEISPGGPAFPESTFAGPVLEDPDDRQDNGLVAPWDNVIPESPCGKVVAPSTTVSTLELPNLSGLRTAERKLVLTHALEVHKMQVKTNLTLALQKVTSIQQGALPKGISSQEVPSAGSKDGSVMPLNNPLMTQEINMTFLKLVTRALLEWLKDQIRSFFMTDEEVQAYIKSYPLMRQLLSVHDTQPATSGFFAHQAWFYKGLKAGKGIFPNCFGGKQTWDAKFMMNTCKAASAAVRDSLSEIDVIRGFFIFFNPSVLYLY
ncbi:hypothetical protein CEUSTIGMA_g13906.t1 [Chlamydomonas eustigma]|uniref:Uncharacterized protein n=1 Tax=Chlamydomonas eustigma TaxID=1157962 RepID=A0A250XTX0_9CHLO|nr:hypothetical protein CEUSTIGMA_g13906.t1 [Chlamydomonas eustigma]|eukprot:GAX86498.1 hypothetical protein CEUSTIGMA_g13906.t1 [Chlamydomonas eustigma]